MYIVIRDVNKARGHKAKARGHKAKAKARGRKAKAKAWPDLTRPRPRPRPQGSRPTRPRGRPFITSPPGGIRGLVTLCDKGVHGVQNGPKIGDVTNG